MTDVKVTSEDIAKANQVDFRKLELKGQVSVKRITNKITVDALRAFYDGKSVISAIRPAFTDLENLITGAMIGSHLRGRLNSAKNSVDALAQRNDKFMALSNPYDEAIKFVKTRMDIPSKDIDKLSKKYSSEAIRVTKVFSKEVERKLNKAIAKVITKGMHVKDGIVEVRNALNAAGVTPQNSYTVENLVRTQISLAYGAGRWNMLQDPDIQEILWGFTYFTVGDDRVRPNHAAMDGTTLPKDDVFWKTNWPPNGWSCRCTVVEVFEPVPEVRPKTEINGMTVNPQADKGWNFNPGTVYKDLIQSREEKKKESPSGKWASHNEKRTGLSEQSKIGLDVYTSMNDTYMDINYSLREGVDLKKAESLIHVDKSGEVVSHKLVSMEDVVSGLDQAMFPVQEDLKVYRGTSTISGVDWSQMKGKDFTDLGYISTTLSKKIADSFSGQGGHESLFFEIKVPKGAKAVTGSKKEMELILPHGTKLKIIDATRVGRYGWRIETEVI